MLNIAFEGKKNFKAHRKLVKKMTGAPTTNHGQQQIFVNKLIHRYKLLLYSVINQ